MKSPVMVVAGFCAEEILTNSRQVKKKIANRFLTRALKKVNRKKAAKR
jgi:hypothetical protein